MKITKIKYGQIGKVEKAIFGFPGIGNVSKIVVDFLIDKLNAKKVMDVYSDEFPNAVIIKDDFTIDTPKIEVYKYKNILFFSGEVQPSNEKASYELSEEIVKLVKSLKVKEIITLGGIALTEEPLKPKVYAAMNDKKYKKKLEKIGVYFNKKGANLIIGLSGLILFYGKLHKIGGFSLLAETSGEPNAIGLRASRSIIEILNKYLKISVSLKDLNEEIRKLRKKEADKREMKVDIERFIGSDGKLNYIG